MKSRICVVTAGHVSTCPRMLKAADALCDAGYQVRVISTRFIDWATRADEALRKTRRWDWEVIDYTRATGRSTYLRSGLRSRSAQILAKTFGSSPCPLYVAARAYSRVHTELLRLILREPADLFYGGTSGVLAAVAAAAKTAAIPYALDLEDFHSAEQEDVAEASLAHKLVLRIERTALPGAAFLTAAGSAIASAYREKYGIQPIPINNTFPLSSTVPDFTQTDRRGLMLYWFSQTIGPGRGLEDAVRAMGLAEIPGELHLRGRAEPGYIETLCLLAAQSPVQLRIVHHNPAPPDSMVDFCRGFDIGLALEQTHVLNRTLCLTNKAFTYMLAGLAVAFTDTPGQRPLALDLGEGAILYRPGDIAGLAAGLKRWSENKAMLCRAKKAAWTAAKRRWHWEHAQERGALLEAVDRALHNTSATGRARICMRITGKHSGYSDVKRNA